MKFARGLLQGTAIWIILILEISFLKFSLKLNEMESAYYLLHYLFFIVVTAMFSVYYFNNLRDLTKPIEGFELGLTYLLVCLIYILVGMLLDLLMITNFFVKDISAFISLEMLGSYLIILIVPTIVALIKREA